MTARRQRTGPALARLGAVLVLLVGWLVVGTAAASAGTVSTRPGPVVAGTDPGSATGFAAVVPAAVTDSMPSFRSEMVLDDTGAVTITETITYDFGTGAGQRHGIYRRIVVRQGIDGQTDSYRYYAMSGVSVSSPSGANADVQVVDEGDAVRIKIGSAKVTVSGTQTYVVRYRLANVMNPIGDTAEFYYNVFAGDSVPKDTVEVEVSAPDTARQVRCTRGTGADCGTADPGPPVRFGLVGLQSREDMTIAVQYPASAFGTLAPDIRSSGSSLGAGPARAVSIAALAAGVLAPLVALGAMVGLVSSRGRDEWYAGVTPGLTPAETPAGTPVAATPPTTRGSPPTVAVQFTPPTGVPPGLVGGIVDERIDTLDVSASVIDLAARGFLRIEEVSSEGAFSRTDWQLTRLAHPPQERLRPYESTLLGGLFQDANPVLLSSLKNEFASTLASVKDQMYDEMMARRWFRSSPEGQRVLWRSLGYGLVVAGVLLAFFVGGATRGIDRTAGIGLPVTSGMILGGGLAIAGLIVQFLGSRLVAKTAAGSATYAQALGFKQYLVTAEANQIRWEEAQDLFSRWLPYAIVFGVAKKWADTFQQVAQSAAAAGHVVSMPSWYIYHGTAFPDFGSVVDGVDSFSSTASGTFTSTPGSSGGSGFSGGGSFSGGGVGGSSSGSW